MVDLEPSPERQWRELEIMKDRLALEVIDTIKFEHETAPSALALMTRREKNLFLVALANLNLIDLIGTTLE
ncbi:hypothetical protein Dda_1932 [Drechslerella dactyloides]|uniref:Uncharacterized protein n=1 Tax=Drechslerella dactyloides TaxID=74499 RepID=A0AAD6J2K4_DREDA|nr:hypothetical protein Dda_1932 [Drechslerella dactyloides]